MMPDDSINVEPADAPEATQQPPAASQQPVDGGADAPEDKPAEGMVPKAEMESVIAQRQALKEERSELRRKLAEAAERANTMPTAEELQGFQEWKTDHAKAAQDKALSEGDADAIATAAREPLLRERDDAHAEATALRTQLTTLLRDQALGNAVRKSEHGAVDPEIVIDALRGRVAMETVAGEFVPVFRNPDGNPLFNAEGKVSDMQVFVDDYLKSHPAQCKPLTPPGSGAKPAGGTPPPTDALPTTVEEFSALPADQRQTVADKLGSDGVKKLLGVTKQDERGYL